MKNIVTILLLILFINSPLCYAQDNTTQVQTITSYTDFALINYPVSQEMIKNYIVSKIKPEYMVINPDVTSFYYKVKNYMMLPFLFTIQGGNFVILPLVPLNNRLVFNHYTFSMMENYCKILNENSDIVFLCPDSTKISVDEGFKFKYHQFEPDLAEYQRYALIPAIEDINISHFIKSSLKGITVIVFRYKDKETLYFFPLDLLKHFIDYQDFINLTKEIVSFENTDMLNLPLINTYIDANLFFDSGGYGPKY